MARISGVNIPTNKKVNIALTYIFGIGPKIAGDICNEALIDITKRVSELNEDEVNKIRDVIDQKHGINCISIRYFFANSWDKSNCIAAIF